MKLSFRQVQRARKKAGVPEPRLPHEGGNNCSGETNLPLCPALFAPHAALPGRLAVRQERPKFFAGAESLALAIADTLSEPGQFPAAFHTAPVYPNDVTVQGLASPGSRRVRSQDTPSPVTDRIQIQWTEGSVNGKR
jgi:hypothetical protein